MAENPLSVVKAQIAEFLRRMIQPHTLTFNLSVVTAVGIITAIFGTIILLMVMVMVATNFNLLNIIE
jgi:hypothetical protein